MTQTEWLRRFQIATDRGWKIDIHGNITRADGTIIPAHEKIR